MEQILISFTKSDLQDLIAETVNACLRHNNQVQQGSEPQDELLTVPKAAEFLCLSVPTIYGLIAKGQIPVMKRSKRCYFSKAELVNYLKQGRKQSNSEIESQAQNFINRKAK